MGHKHNPQWPGHPYFSKPKGWKSPKELQYAALQEQYKQGYASLTWAVLDVHFREEMSIEQTANILNVTARQVQVEIDIIRQHAQ